MFFKNTGVFQKHRCFLVFFKILSDLPTLYHVRVDVNDVPLPFSFPSVQRSTRDFLGENDKDLAATEGDVEEPEGGVSEGGRGGGCNQLDFRSKMGWSSSFDRDEGSRRGKSVVTSAP